MAFITRFNFTRHWLSPSLQSNVVHQPGAPPVVRRSAMRAAVISMVMRSLCDFAGEVNERTEKPD